MIGYTFSYLKTKMYSITKYLKKNHDYKLLMAE